MVITSKKLKLNYTNIKVDSATKIIADSIKETMDTMNTIHHSEVDLQVKIENIKTIFHPLDENLFIEITYSIHTTDDETPTPCSIEETFGLLQ